MPFTRAVTMSSLVFLMVVAGCGIVRESPAPIRMYLLEMPRGESRDSTRLSSEVIKLPRLLVDVPQPAPGFESSRMAYVQVPHELNYFAASQWVESSARMLTPLLIQSLEKSGMWQSVISMPTSIRGDYRLDLTQVMLVQDFLHQPSRMLLVGRGQLVNMKSRKVIGTRTFEREENAASEDAYGGVLAAQQATKRFLNDLNEWLNGCLQENSSMHC